MYAALEDGKVKTIGAAASEVSIDPSSVRCRCLHHDHHNCTTTRFAQSWCSYKMEGAVDPIKDLLAAYTKQAPSISPIFWSACDMAEIYYSIL
jgi:hypothetical protein